jgi:hypothetical protein
VVSTVVHAQGAIGRTLTYVGGGEHKIDAVGRVIRQVATRDRVGDDGLNAGVGETLAQRVVVRIGVSRGIVIDTFWTPAPVESWYVVLTLYRGEPPMCWSQVLMMFLEVVGHVP